MPPEARLPSFFSFTLSLFIAACGGDDLSHGSPSLDAGASLDAQVVTRDASRMHDTSDAHTTRITTGTTDECSRDLQSASSSCAPHRVTTEAIALSLGSTCTIVQGATFDKDATRYGFGVVKSDPVRIELATELGGGSGALSFSVRDAYERVIGNSVQGDLIFQARAGSEYDVALEPARVGTCLPYALRVDARWCTDDAEDNDDENSATALSSTAGSLHVVGTISEADPDYFVFTTPRADPVQLNGSYRVADGNTLQLRRTLTNTSGLGTLDVEGMRTGSTESFTHWLLSNSAGAVFRARLGATGTGCASYDIAFAPDACTDDFEDNDVATSPSRVSSGQTISASIFHGDDDYFDVSALVGGGTCHVAFTRVTGNHAPVRLAVLRGASGSLASSDASHDATSATVSWSGAANLLFVSLDSPDVCQPYTLRCDPATN